MAGRVGQLALAAARNGDATTADGALQMADTLEPGRAGQWRRVLASGWPLPIGELGFEPGLSIA